MKEKQVFHQHHQLLKTGYFIAGMILSVLFTKIADLIFPPEPVVVHTVIDSVKIVHEFKRRNKSITQPSVETKTHDENSHLLP